MTFLCGEKTRFASAFLSSAFVHVLVLFFVALPARHRTVILYPLETSLLELRGEVNKTKAGLKEAAAYPFRGKSPSLLKNTRPSGSRSDNPLLQKKISPIPGKSEDNPAPEDKNLGTGTDMLVRGSAPTYPKEAQNLNLTGEVVLKVTVIKGAAQEISILISSGVKMLDEHAKKTIEKQWQFKEEFFPYAVRISLQFTQNDVILTFLDAKKI